MGGPLHMEHFTAAQGAGKSNVGFGLEDPNTAVNQAHPAHDFESFVSTHLGFEPEEQFGAQVSRGIVTLPCCFPTCYMCSQELGIHSACTYNGHVGPCFRACAVALVHWSLRTCQNSLGSPDSD